MVKLEGGCLCGAVRYRSTADPVMTLLCQCEQCQRHSASAFSLNIGFAKATLMFTGDTPATYEHKGGSGKTVHRHFCAKCGSPIVTELDSTPELDWLKAGTLDDKSWLRPDLGIFGSEGQVWLTLPDGMPQFPKAPPAA
jgi:hypothetical protein